MTDLYIVGVSMTPFGKFLDKSVKALTAEAVAAALTDAACGKEAIGRNGKAAMPKKATAAIKSEVAIGRRMNGSERFTAASLHLRTVVR